MKTAHTLSQVNYNAPPTIQILLFNFGIRLLEETLSMKVIDSMW